MRSHAARLVLVLAVLCLTALLARAQDPPPGIHCITGIVFEDVNNNGSFDPETDQCLQGAQVTLSTGAVDFNECDDFVGYFFGSLAAGTYTVSTAPPGYTSNSATVTVSGDSFPCGFAFPCGEPTRRRLPARIIRSGTMTRVSAARWSPIRRRP
jgi:hypothetical protein